jgi:hypothetical protein
VSEQAQRADEGAHPSGSEPSAAVPGSVEELRAKVAHQERTIRALMAGREEIAAELGWSEAPDSGLIAARCGRLRIERGEAQEKARLLEKLHIEEARAHQETIGWWREAMAERDALRAQLGPAKLGATIHQERADQLVIGLQRLLDRDREIENGPAPLPEASSEASEEGSS